MKNYIAEKVKEFKEKFFSKKRPGDLSSDTTAELLESFLTKALEETAEKAKVQGQVNISEEILRYVESQAGISGRREIVEFIKLRIDQLTKEKTK